MKLNFEQMSTPELKAYVLTHKEDDEATWYGLFTTADGVPIEENICIAEEAIKQCIEQDSN